MATKTVITIGEAARTARQNAGMSQADVAFATRALPAAYWMSQTKVARIERDAPLDPEDVLVLATIYGTSVTDLSPDAAEALDGLRLLLTRTPAWITGLPEKRRGHGRRSFDPIPPAPSPVAHAA